MDFRLYSVRDDVAEEFGPLFQAINDGVAWRAYRGLMRDVPPIDQQAYRLFCIGSWSSETGSMVSLIEPCVVRAEVDLEKLDA
nr:MAG: nonstructural protein [Microviridae sp.]